MKLNGRRLQGTAKIRQLGGRLHIPAEEDNASRMNGSNQVSGIIIQTGPRHSEHEQPADLPVQFSDFQRGVHRSDSCCLFFFTAPPVIVPAGIRHDPIYPACA
jgi:hypothetical protein